VLPRAPIPWTTWPPVLLAWRRRHWRPSAPPSVQGDTGDGRAGDESAPFIVITGGSEGIGLALAHRFAAAGHNVMVVARSASNVVAAADALMRKYQIVAVGLAVDVTRADAALAIDQALIDADGYCDVLINNAGMGLSGDFMDATPDDIDQVLQLNIAALTRLTRHFLPAMRARGRGGILNVSSLAALTPGPYQAVYYASKAYVLSLTEALAHEVAGQGVTMSALVPGATDTAFHRRMGATSALYSRILPMPTPETVARLAYRRFRIGQRVIAPGIIATIAVFGARVTPHWILVPLMAAILKLRP
jgi:uncharacterized protein